MVLLWVCSWEAVDQAWSVTVRTVHCGWEASGLIIIMGRVRKRRRCLFHPALECPNADGLCVFVVDESEGNGGSSRS